MAMIQDKLLLGRLNPYLEDYLGLANFQWALNMLPDILLYPLLLMLLGQLEKFIIDWCICITN